MTSHKDYRLDQLGIPSQYEADELERDLNVRFDMFTYNDREVWVQQNVYLDAYAYNRTVSESADMAGVPISNAAPNGKNLTSPAPPTNPHTIRSP